MRALEECLADASNLFDEIQKRDDDAERNRIKEYNAAVTIQKHIRGYLDRGHIERLNAAALCIQRHWRGFKGREAYMAVLQERVDEKRRARYGYLATCIQKVWHGYVVRSSVFNYRVFKERVLEVLRESEELLSRMKESRKGLEILTLDALELDAKLWVRFIVFKTHHLIRTTVTPGVYSDLTSTKLSDLEKLMRGLRYTTYTKVLRDRRKRARDKAVSYLPTDLRSMYWQEMKRMHDVINVDPDIVTDAKSTRKCGNMHFRKPHAVYEASLQNSEPYSVPAYPFRLTDSTKNISKKNFVTVCKPQCASDPKSYVFDGPFCPLHCSKEILDKLLSKGEK